MLGIFVLRNSCYMTCHLISTIHCSLASNGSFRVYFSPDLTAGTLQFVEHLAGS